MANTPQLGVADLDRLLQQDAEFVTDVMNAVAATLRQRYEGNWLLQFSTPEGLDERDQTALSEAFLSKVQTLVDRGQLQSLDMIRDACHAWIQRLVKSRSDQWTRLGEATDRAAQAVSSRMGLYSGAGSGEIFLSPENRAQVAAEVAQQITGFLGIERAVSTEPEILALADGLVKENLGAGALEEFLQDQSLSEIMVANNGHVWVERSGALEDTGKTVPERRALWFGQRLAAVIGSRIDTAEPSMDGFLPDGSRVHILVSPIAMDGVTITIRRHAKRPTMEQLIEWGALSPELSDFLKDVVLGRANILISGGTSSGKTSLLGVAANFIPDSERVVTMEDSPELKLRQPHTVRLRTRRSNIEGKGEFTMRMLVKESLRMRPDRIVVGEVRGAEALDMIEGLNTGHDGGLSTAHANSPLDMLKRLAQMMKRGDHTLTNEGAYELIASSLHMVVHAERRVIEGKVIRGVDEVVEIVGYDPSKSGTNGLTLRTIFKRDRTGLRQVGTISPKLAEHLSLNGEDVSRWT